MRPATAARRAAQRRMRREFRAHRVLEGAMFWIPAALVAGLVVALVVRALQGVLA